MLFLGDIEEKWKYIIKKKKKNKINNYNQEVSDEERRKMLTKYIWSMFNSYGGMKENQKEREERKTNWFC